MKIKISITNLRLRADHTTKSESLGFAKANTYEVSNIYQGSDYKWYKISGGWVAGVDGVEELEDSKLPVPVERDKNKNQIYVNTGALRIRSGPSTSYSSLGFCDASVYYNVYDAKNDAVYTWYKIGDGAWCAGVNGVTYFEAGEEHEWQQPVAVDADETKDQVYIGNVSLNIRKTPDLKGEKMGVCERYVNYYVYEEKQNEYVWYKIGDNAWIADADKEVLFYPAGSSRIIPQVKDALAQLENSLAVAKKCVDKSISTQYYKDLYDKVNELNTFINENLDAFDYDYVENREYAGIDLLYTADVHGAWVGYSMDGNYSTPVFSYDDIGAYRDKLAKSNIKALLVDAGDWSRPSKAYNDYLNTGIMYPAQEMKEQGYFLATYGNHEWRWSTYGEADTEYDILDKLIGVTTACNLFKNGKTVYRPYRTAKIGSKKIGIIGIGYPSANGNGSYEDGIWTYGDYQFYDNDKLFKEVQKHIDTLKSNGFDYIVAVCHMCKSTYESDSRYKARTDSLIQNTKGLTAVIQGHYNFATNAEIIKDKGGNNVLLAHESGANLNSFGRLMLRKGTVTSYLLDERSDLNMV